MCSGCITQKSGRGPPHSRTLHDIARRTFRGNVADSASPLALCYFAFNPASCFANRMAAIIEEGFAMPLPTRS